MIFGDMINWMAFAWFLTCWIGYTIYAKKRAGDTECLSALLYSYRADWMKSLLHRENRISDLALLNNLVQMVNFLATTNIFILAGAVTVLYSSQNVMELLAHHAFVAPTTVEQVQFKLLVLVIIFVYAFFRFTWAMRQHTFVSILIGAAPFVPPGTPLTRDEEEFAIQLAKISDRAGHEFNYGLRSYYFALSLLTWFIGPLVLIPTCTLVMVVLYLREFRSRTLKFLIRSRENYIRIYQKAA
ncbi:MAG TPA: DUF599 domain-containing protein [Patescibacteria group bacterium]|nr:DUF599 domain-containing protein [Patescibacteria group bacterium]